MESSNFKYGVLFISLIFIIDVLVGSLLEDRFFEITTGKFGTINKSLKTQSNILILGSSRALHHYNPEIFSERLNESCYNSGIGGYGLFINFAILNERVKKSLPKIVILDLSPNVIEDYKSYEKLNALLPYYKNYSSFKEIIELDPKFSKLETISNLYIYNSIYYDLFRDYLSKNRDSNNGFIPLDGNINTNNFKPFFLNQVEVDKNKITYLNKIINLCKINSIKLIGVVSPTYEKFDRNNEIINELKTIFKKNDVDFFDYSNYLKVYKDTKYFKDQLHLNAIGAKVFSTDLVKRIKNER